MSSPPPPPKRFNAAVGVRSARFLPCKPPFISRGRSRGRFAVGIRYEREVQEFLSLFVLGRAELEHRSGPWLEYSDKSGKRWCQPDALIIEPAAKRCLVAEVKYQHTSDAWYQLRRLYLPVLRVALPGYVFNLLEIVHWYDPSTSWPQRAINVPNLDQCVGGNRWGEEVATLIFNVRRERRLHEARDSKREGSGEAARPLWPAEGAT